MEIVTDEPGRSLVVAETAPRMPLALFVAGLALVLLVAAPWRGLWAMVAHGPGAGSLDLAGSAVWLAIGLLFLLSLRGGSRIERIAADREGGVAVRSTHLAGFFGWTHRVPADHLQGLTLDVAPGSMRAARSDSGRARPLRLRLTLRTAKERRRAIPLALSQVGRTPEVADLALRLGAAVGLPYYRVVGSDAEQFEIELLRAAEPDAKTVPPLGGRADYARDVVAPPANAAAAEKARRFDPSAFEGTPRVTVWDPRRRVCLEKSWGASALVAPLLAAGLAGPLAWWRLPGLHALPALPRIAALTLITLVGLAVAVVGWVGLTGALPRRVTLDWDARRLDVDGVRAARRVSFAEIEAIELRARSFRARQRQNQYTMYYWCEVRAILRAPAGPPMEEILAETRRYREDRVTPHVAAAPLARELAASLHVEEREASS